ncbi:hypothetical protein CPB97_007546 [Podila verticillata]|nr:hypothetical protein CPB97_007546 [Podila verticillata]
MILRNPPPVPDFAMDSLMPTELVETIDLPGEPDTYLGTVEGGNQRDKDREKAQKKLAQQNKGKKTDGVSHTKRAESDAEIMRAKQAAKEAAKTAGGGASK